jgi:hypothetical protein
LPCRFCHTRSRAPARARAGGCAAALRRAQLRCPTGSRWRAARGHEGTAALSLGVCTICGQMAILSCSYRARNPIPRAAICAQPLQHGQVATTSCSPACVIIPRAAASGWTGCCSDRQSRSEAAAAAEACSGTPAALPTRASQSQGEATPDSGASAGRRGHASTHGAGIAVEEVAEIRAGPGETLCAAEHGRNAESARVSMSRLRYRTINQL